MRRGDKLVLKGQKVFKFFFLMLFSTVVSASNSCAVLTADDAYQSIAENAYPLLKKYQMPISVFVSSDVSIRR